MYVRGERLGVKELGGEKKLIVSQRQDNAGRGGWVTKYDLPIQVWELLPLVPPPCELFWELHRLVEVPGNKALGTGKRRKLFVGRPGCIDW